MEDELASWCCRIDLLRSIPDTTQNYQENTTQNFVIYTQLQQQAWKIGQEVLWWETTRSLRRYHYQGAWHNLMPDALFEYQAKESRVEAWLEWDTGSMHCQPLTVKFDAYAQYY